MDKPALITNSGASIPQLAFGTYKIPNDETGEKIIAAAIRAGYRHFDTASFYGNEETLGKALKKSGIPRDNFYICTKVWNTAQKEGRHAVRESVEQSLHLLSVDCVDLVLIHWPVPGLFVETYKELEDMRTEGKISSLGLSNFTPEEYEVLLRANVKVPPSVNQFEVSPSMYRAKDVGYFLKRKIVVSASKAMTRGASFEAEAVTRAAKKHGVTPAQVLLRWGLQKGLVIVAKTSTLSRMKENRAITGFELSPAEMLELDRLTTAEAIRDREELEKVRKQSL